MTHIGFTAMIDMLKVKRPAEISAVAALASEIWKEYFVPIVGQEQVDYMLAKFQSAPAITRQIADGYEYFLVVDAGRYIGYFAIVPHPAEAKAQLSKIYVMREKRGGGIGKAILLFVEKRCVEMGIREVWLTVNRHNTASIAFYRKMGFVKSESIVQDIGNGFVMDDDRMAKRL